MIAAFYWVLAMCRLTDFVCYHIFACTILQIRKGVFFFFNFYLFIFGCVGSSLLHAGFFQLRQAGSTLHCGVRASRCGCFSL